MADDEDLDDLLDEFSDSVLSGRAPLSLDPRLAQASTAVPQSLETLIEDLDIKDPHTKQEFQELARHFQQDKTKDAEDFGLVVKNTMDRLHKREQTLDEQLNEPAGPANHHDILAQLLAGGGDEGKDVDILNVLTELLDLLLSKEVLYEPMKDLSTKYPTWLQDHKASLLDQDNQNYTTQHRLGQEIVTVFEDPAYDDSDKNKRLRVNQLLEELQELGLPPKELVGDSQGIPGLDGALDDADLQFSDKDLPPELEKELEQTCKQQ